MDKILIIEDDKNINENITSALTINNYDVYSAENGKTGYNSALKIKPDLILCDIMMPELDGYWVLENIKKKKEFFDTPFIFITAKVEREDLRKGMELGADDYLMKPFKIEELLRAIEVRLTKKKGLTDKNDEKISKSIKIDKDNFILLDTGKKIERVQINSVECILADNIYSEIVLVDSKTIITRKSLNDWEKLLPEDIFIRIHRGTIINLTLIKQVEKWFNQTLIIHMQNYDKPLTMSRSYSKKLKGNLIIS